MQAAPDPHRLPATPGSSLLKDLHPRFSKGLSSRNLPAGCQAQPMALTILDLSSYDSQLARCRWRKKEDLACSAQGIQYEAAPSACSASRASSLTPRSTPLLPLTRRGNR